MSTLQKGSKDSMGRTSLMYTVIDDKKEIYGLVTEGVDIDAQDNDGRTALHFAVQSYRVDAITLLLQAGARVDLKDKFGNTPLCTAVNNSQGRGEIIRLLLKGGAEKNTKNLSGLSALDLARTIVNYDVVQFFA
jgi:ankyrin repeat protein